MLEWDNCTYCMYNSIYIYIYIYICIHTYTWCVSIIYSLCMFKSVYIGFVCMYIHVYMCICIYMYMYIHESAEESVYAYIYIYIYMFALLSMNGFNVLFIIHHNEIYECIMIAIGIYWEFRYC